MKSTFKRFTFQFIFWFLALTFYFFLRTFGKISFIEVSTFQWPFLLGTLGLIAAISFTGIDYFLNTMKSSNIPFGQMIMRSTFIYLLTSILLYLIAIVMIVLLFESDKNGRSFLDFLISKEILSFIIYSTVAGIVMSFIQEINKKLGPGNLLKFINGKFYSPEEDEKIFLFLDLKSSTKTAEILGHKNYSAMIQECFRDISIIDKYGGEFYQFVGDEAVITWPIVNEENACKAILGFFHYKTILEKKSDLYLGKYGIKPEFKGSIHGGKVMVAEVGEIKREIAFHGDPINTTARIQSMCNELGEVLLVSEFLNNLGDIINKKFQITNKHILHLKGKKDETIVFGVRQKRKLEDGEKVLK